MIEKTLHWWDGKTPRAGSLVAAEDGYALVWADWPTDPAKVRKLTAKEVEQYFPKPSPPASVGETKKWTAEQVAKTNTVAFLKAETKRLNLSTAGSELVVAQRLLDNGWVPK